jgi:hypothetical protein
MERVCQQKKEKDWKLPVVMGKGLVIGYSVTCTPKLVLIDGEAVVQEIIIGWGSETQGELEAGLRRIFRR